MSQKRIIRSFTPEFRMQAVKLVLEEKISAVKVADDLGISVSTLYGWMDKFRGGVWNEATGTAFCKPQNVSPTSKKASISMSEDKLRIQELERQNRRLMLERDILKKAMAYCVDVPK